MVLRVDQSDRRVVALFTCLGAGVEPRYDTRLVPLATEAEAEALPSCADVEEVT